MTRRSPKGEIAILRRIHLFERLYADMKENEPYSQVGSTSITFTIGGPAEGITTDVNRQELRSYLLAFRQLISDDDPVFLPRLLRLLVRHVDDAELRERLGRALDAWKAAQGFPSPLAQLSYGEYGTGRGTARLYLNGGVFHSDPELSDVWDALGPDQQTFMEYAFQQYDSKVRNVFIEVKRVITAARDGGFLRDEPLDLAEPAEPDGPD